MIICPKNLYKLGIAAHLDQDKLQDLKMLTKIFTYHSQNRYLLITIVKSTTLCIIQLHIN